MVNTTQRQECENYISYIKRITELCLNKTISYSEWCNYLLDEEDKDRYGKENCRKGFYILSKIFNKIYEDIDITEDDIKDNLEELKDTIYKERVKLQDANREKRKYLRDFSRVETLIEYIDKKVQTHEPIVFNIPTYTINENNEASLLVSDLHCGATVDSIFNYYDIETMKERLEELSSKTIEFCKMNQISHLNVELLGDFITGIIHGSTIAQAQEDVIDQIFTVSDVLIEFIKSLRKEIPSIKVFSEYGNHGRTKPKKTDGANRENFERLIAPYIRKSLKNTDIKVIDGGYEDFITYKLKNGKLIVITHGTNDSPNNANQVFSKLLGQDVYEVHMGHYHEYKEVSGTVVNGSVMASDDYAISIRKNSSSVQILKVYYNSGDSSTFKLNLK